MTRKEFYELYSQVRKGKRDFLDSMRSMYCGESDAAGENFDNEMEEFLSDKPALKLTLETRYDDDYLYERQENMRFKGNPVRLKGMIKYRMSA